MNLETEFLANSERPVADAILAALEEYTDAFFAVAYGTYRAFEVLEEKSAISRYLRSGRRLRVFFDADRHFTDPKLIYEFATVPGDVECRLFAPRARSPEKSEQAAVFHAKVYYFQCAERAAAIVGSTNFSPGGLQTNTEAAVRLCGPVDAPPFVTIRGFLDELWDSPFQIGVLENTEFLQKYEEAYKAARKRVAALPIPSEAPIYQTSDDVAQLREAITSGSELVHESTLAYILGLISGGFQRSDLRRRSITIRFRRGLLNRKTNREGQVFFEGVSENALDQRECVRRDAERIVTRLRRAFELLRTGDRVTMERRADLNYRIHLKFARNSRIWRMVRDELRAAGNSLQYLWPRSLDLERGLLRQPFLQGYMDLRTRISATDALPPPHSIMRIAISVGGNAPDEFARDLHRLLAAEFGCEPRRINLLHGASRGRESLIRIDARILPVNFLESHWQRIVVEDFREFNERVSSAGA